MQHTDEIINYLLANEILAKKLDRAFNGLVMCYHIRLNT